MTTQIQAQLYRADQRGCSQTAHARSLHTLNFGSYIDEHRAPFGSLTTLNDNQLTAGHSLNRRIDQPTDVVVIPVMGGLEFDGHVGHGFIQTGQAQAFSLDPGMELMIRNPYKTEVIRFIEIWLTNPSGNYVATGCPVAFDLLTKNRLLPFTDPVPAETSRQPFAGFIGHYDGRRNGVYQAKTTEDQPPSTGIFVFILAGAFEVQDRLLQAGDGLALSITAGQLIEFEALSNEAIVLLLDIP